MKKLLYYIPTLFFILIGFGGCSFVGEKSNNISTIYCATTIFSLLLLIICICYVHKSKFWFITLFSSVLVVNIGYLLLSISSSLEMALWANRISYLGSVFLPLSMLMNILNVTNTKYKKFIPPILFGIAFFIFLLAASPGILTIYYKEVSFAVIDNVSTLIKVYGPLHPLYLVYLLGYFGAMITIIVRSNIKKTIDTTSHAIFIAMAVFVNIGIWFIEQIVSFDFEMLSISYIISELFLLGVHLVIKENQHLREIVSQIETSQNILENNPISADTMLEKPIGDEKITPEQIDIFMTGLRLLTPTEKTIFDAYIARVTTKEIMMNLNIKETTLKYHNRNIYGKLGVSTRKELMEVHKYIKSANANIKKEQA